MTTTFIKDPQAILDYSFVWTAWLDTGETITANTVTVETGLTKGDVTTSDNTITVWLSGGTAGEDYDVTCHITTSDTRQDDRTMTIKCRQR